MSFAHFSLLSLLGVDTHSFGLPIYFERPSLLYLVVPVSLAYPIMWLCAQSRPRFNWPAEIGIAVVFLIPYLGSELQALQSFTAFSNYLLSQQTANVEYARAIVCIGDPTKIDADALNRAKQVLADPKFQWSKPGIEKPLSAVQWSKQPDQCAYDAQVVSNAALSILANTHTAARKLFLALTAAAALGAMLLLGFAANELTRERLRASFPEAFRRPGPPRAPGKP